MEACSSTRVYDLEDDCMEIPDEYNVTVDTIESELKNDTDDLSLLVPEDIRRDEAVALWVKRRGRWQAGIRCARADWPLATLKAKPNHDRNKYFLVFFPHTKNYSWADMTVIRSIQEFPQPNACSVHRAGLKIVKDLNVARRFIIKKLAIDMLNVVDQLHQSALVDAARDVMFWKEFAKEAGSCNDYSNLGRMLMKVHDMILPEYIDPDWLQQSWAQQCQIAQAAESVEQLKEELFKSILWSEVNALSGGQVQRTLGPEWKLDVLKWLSGNEDLGQRSESPSNMSRTSNSQPTPPLTIPMCQGTTVFGNRCKHRALQGSSFCKKHGPRADNAAAVGLFRCRYCGSKFDSLPDLGRHHQAFHIQSAQPRPINVDIKVNLVCEDISFGKESMPIACVVDEDLLPSVIVLPDVSDGQLLNFYAPWDSFTYITRPLLDQSRNPGMMNLQLGCACPLSSCLPERCDHVYLFDTDFEDAIDIFGKSMHGRFPYDNNGRLILEEGYLVYECNRMCSCTNTCPNRILQNGLRMKLQVFNTKNKGWAVRACEPIPKGTFVCEYIGEVLDEKEANERRGRYGEQCCSYMYVIDDHANNMSRLIEGRENYVIDATKYGNISRFINHSCMPNLVSRQVVFDSMEASCARIGLYASRDILSGEELTHNYRYGDGLPCHCGTTKCTNRKYFM